jgi:hypothetical protein
MATVSHGLSLNLTSNTTSRIQAGGANTGIVSTASAAKKTSR